MKFRKKPIEIEAFQWLLKGNFINWKSLPKWLTEAYEKGDIFVLTDGIEIKTLEGWYKANIGDWIIQGIKGEIYPCKPDIFEMTYEPVEEKCK